MSAILGANLVRIRQAQEKTREQVAEAMGVSVFAYQKWEQNQREPSFDQLSQLATYFGVSCEEFHRADIEERKPGRPSTTRKRKK